MIGTIINTIALLVGTSIGCLLKKGLNKGFEDVLFIAMGLAALGIGWENVTNNMPKSHYPVLFIVSLALGGIAGTALDIAGHFDRLVDRVGKSNLGKGLATEILLCCIGALSIVVFRWQRDARYPENNMKILKRQREKFKKIKYMV